jgi:hypothetical protein
MKENEMNEHQIKARIDTLNFLLATRLLMLKPKTIKSFIGKDARYG